MKSSLIEIPRIFDIKSDRSRQIRSYDIDNGFPQRCIWLVDNSVTAGSCVELFSDFMFGEGFTDENFGNQVIGPNDLTLNELAEGMFTSWAIHRGSAIVVSVNGLFEHVAYQLMPFERVRYGDGKKEGKFAVHEHWGILPGKKFKTQDIQWYHPYTEDPKKIMEYIEEDGGFENFRGMLLYHSIDPLGYPTPKYSAALNDIETEAGAGIFKRRNVTTGFMASHIFKYSEEFENEEDRQAEMEKLKSFQGANNGSKIFMIDGADSEDGQDLEVEKVDIQDVDRLFEYTEESAADNIRKRFNGLPKALLGHEESTGFDTQRIKDARAYYNSVVTKDRMKAIAPLKKIISKFEIPLTESVSSFDITPLYQDDGADNDSGHTSSEATE